MLAADIPQELDSVKKCKGTHQLDTPSQDCRLKVLLFDQLTVLQDLHRIDHG